MSAQARSAPQPSPRSPLKSPPALLAAVVVALAALFVHWPAVHHGFTNWDDTHYIVDNPQLRTLDGLGRIWTTGESPQYYPLTFTSFWLEYQRWGAAPAGYHATNVVLHALNAALVVLLLAALGLPAPLAAVAALLFAVSPIQVMSVAWVAERKNVLSTFFGLLALLAAVDWFVRGGRWRMGFLLVAFAAAVLSKSAWLVLPVVVFLLGVIVLRVPWKRGLRDVLLMLPVAIVLGYITWRVEQQQFSDPGIPPLAQRLLIAPGALLTYLVKSLAPYQLGPVYPAWTADPASPLAWWPLAAALALAALVLWKRRALHPLQLWGLAAFAVFLLPILGILPYGNLAATWVSDHFVYYAVIGLYAAAVLAVWQLLQRFAGRAAAPVGAIAALAVAAGWTWNTRAAQIPVWRDAFSLAERAIQSAPDRYVGYAFRANAHHIAGHVDAAIDDLRAALQRQPHAAPFRYQLADLLNQRGQSADAIAELRRVIADDPQTIGPYRVLADLLARQGDQAGAIDALRAAVAADAGRSTALRLEYVDVLAQFGRLEAAEAELNAILAADPANATARTRLGVLAARRGDIDAAGRIFAEALAADPRNTEARLALAQFQLAQNNLADAEQTLQKGVELGPPAVFLLALGHIRESRNQPAEAEAFFRRAAEADPANPDAWFGLGVMCAMQGRFPEAIAAYERTIAAGDANARVWNNLGSALLLSGDPAAAIPKIRRAVELDAGDAKAWFNLGVALRETQQRDEAIGCFARAVELDPTYRRAHESLARCLIDAARYAEAAQRLTNAAALLRGGAGQAIPNMYARLLAACPQDDVRRPDLALELATRLCEATNMTEPDPFDTLGIALAALGRFDEAREAAEKAIALAEAQNRTADAAAFAARRDLYKESKAYVGD